ncbi:RHS repeat-associated core domain-containing protein [Streptomyces sp. NPDC094447]|uniref:RHS repeat-associated core domain-containing protein n=1 Tax=Streptomyces sp. NPDC094447 TaxID=3366062 RepID=UPI003801B7A2
MGTPSWRARKKTARLAALAVITSGALALSSLPAATAVAAGQEGTPVSSAWGRDGGEPVLPKVPVGVNKPVPGEPSAAPSEEEATWRAAEKQRRDGGGPQKSARSALGVLTFVPDGQGQVPWHRYADTRLTDALVARVNLSNGNLMLAATDFDIAGVDQKLQLTRTYNSFTGPYGQVENWWQGYERRLDLMFTNEVIHYDATGATVRFTKNADGTLATPPGYSKDLKKNTDGTYTLTDRKSGSKDIYSSAGDLTKVTDRNSGTITVTRHEQNGEHTGFKLTETRSGRWIDLVKQDGTHWQATDNAGRTVSYELSAPDADGEGGGNLLQSTDADGKSTRYTYDSSNRVEKITTPRGNETLFHYDAQNRVVSMQRLTTGGAGPTWTYSYNTAYPWQAGTTTAVDPDGDTTVHTHNADGEITKVTDPLGHNRSTTYQNRLTQTATDAMGTGTGGTGGNVTAYGWDARNNPISATLPTGANASAQYQTVAGTDLPTSMSDTDGRKDTYAYDTAGNTLSVTTSGTEGGQRSYTYNPASPTCGGFQGQRCTARDANGKTTSFAYDTKGNLTKVTPPAPLGVTTYTYDALGRTATSTDGRGVKTLYTYDARDRITKTDTSGYATVTYTYDADGNIASRADATGTTTWIFDTLNRETIRTLQDGSTTTLAYTPGGGEVDWYTDPNGKTDYTWDKAGRLTELLDPAGKKTTYEYNNNDKRTKTTYPGGTTQSITLDPSNRPTAIKTVSGTTTLVDLTYTYEYGTGGTSNGIKIRTRKDNTTQTTTTYGYDSQGRLKSAAAQKTGETPASWSYSYDKAGNLLTSSTIGSTTYGYNDGSQLTTKDGVATGWSYDKAGNETSAAPSGGTARTGETWTDHSQLKSLTTAGTTRALTHAGTDNTERTSLADTAFHHTALGLTGTTAAGVDTGFIREPVGTLNSVRSDGKSFYYLTDATGNVLGLVDEAGKRTHTYAYSPYGTNNGAPVESFSQPYRYAGTYLDPTGLYKMGARYYDPHLGRFTQPDPSGQETNPYLYAAGDPINHSDPTGLSWVSAIAEGAGDVTEAISNGLNGDTDALWGQAAGIATGIAIESACAFVAGATAVPTGGVAAFALGAGCTIAAAAAGDYVGGKVEDGLKN